MPTTTIAQSKAAEVQSIIDSEGKEIKQIATFHVSFEKMRHLIESSPAPRRPNRNRPIQHPLEEDEFQAWEEASDEALENFDREFPPLES